MSYTKGDIVKSALNEIGIADYDFDLSPEQKQSALQRLDSMIAEWNGRGIMLGYPMSGAVLGSKLEQDSNVPDFALEAIILNLSIRISPSYGKSVSIDTKIQAKNSLDVIIKRCMKLPSMQLPSMPTGAGYKTEYPYSSDPEETNLDYVNEDIEL
ncbi:MAG: packaged DNA stabilization gp4 family protein [Cyclobacteriaceae bacterium]